NNRASSFYRKERNSPRLILSSVGLSFSCPAQGGLVFSPQSPCSKVPRPAAPFQASVYSRSHPKGLLRDDSVSQCLNLWAPFSHSRVLPRSTGRGRVSGSLGRLALHSKEWPGHRVPGVPRLRRCDPAHSPPSHFVLRDPPHLSCPLAPGPEPGFVGSFFYPQESVKRTGLRPEEAGCGLGTLCLVNTWAQCWRATSNPGKEIRLQLDAPGAFGTAGPEVPAADPNKQQAMGSYCYPTARRALYLTIPEAESVFCGWLMPPKPGTASASSTAGVAEGETFNLPKPLGFCSISLFTIINLSLLP
ncbi:hypothetical protein LEMLEM_LOCUS10388, partial [Lemmus lemmus]